MLETATSRIRLLSFGIILVAILLIWNLFNIQVINGEKYQNNTGSEVSDAYRLYNRGSIFFKQKDGQLLTAAGIESGYLLAINPSKIQNIDNTYKLLSKYIKIDETYFRERAQKRNDPYEEISEKINKTTAQKIESLNIVGVSLYPNKWRYYPGRELASHEIGFVGFSDNDYSGRYGLERYYNNILDRKTESIYNNSFVKIFSGIKNVIKDITVQKKGDIVLTIEPDVQDFIETQLADLTEKRKSDESGIIVMDPSTGEILAMASVPTFNPQIYYKETDISVFSNPLVENIYEMGSIMKPLTIAAAFDAGVLSEEDTYNDLGYVEIDGVRIENYDGKGRGVVPIQQILNQSLNTGAIYAMQKLGRGAFRDYMLSYGLGKKTMIDLPNEVAGQVANLKSRGDVEYATASFGQGIAMSPINITRALATLANGGYLVRPHLVKEFQYTDFSNREVYTEEQAKVLKKETSERISRMLVKVVDEALVGGRVALPQYTIAAKTGTAQIPDEEGGYYKDKFLHSFFGYFPAYDPKYIIFLYTVNPKTGRYASQTLTDPFMQTVKFLLNYYEIPPDR